ncbi:MAG TPA: rhomboid family intramembrane serine protease [Gaiellaceae bacterium]|nr:rhomboid family intramembrane serine protease [Gaiellaceae bacterium]
MLPLRDNAPTRHVPVVTLGLIAANVLAWAWQLAGTPVEVDVFRYGYYPCTVSGPCLSPDPSLPAGELSAPLGAITSMFMHGGWDHIVGNMLFLWVFGNNVEDALGRGRFLVWYLAGGVAATAAQTFVTLSFGSPEEASIPHVGASGAVSAVLGAYLVLLPTARVLTLFGWLLVEVPALVYLGIWFLFQLWAGSTSILQPQLSGGVAFFAHVGGFVFGALTVRLVATRRPLRPGTRRSERA